MPVYLTKAHFGKDTIFVHIPRTGGTYVQSRIREAFEPKKLEIFRSIQPHTFGHYTLNNILKTLARNGCVPDANEYFTFTFVRNPFDRIVSSYLNYTIRNMPDFDEYLKMVEHVVDARLYQTCEAIETNDLSHYISQVEMIGRNKVDFLGRFETFESDVKALSEIIGADALKQLVLRKNRFNYRDYYGPSQKRLIQTVYKDDLEAFGYGF